MNVQPETVRCIPSETAPLKKQRKRQPNRLEFVDADWLGLASFLEAYSINTRQGPSAGLALSHPLILQRFVLLIQAFSEAAVGMKRK